MMGCKLMFGDVCVALINSPDELDQALNRIRGDFDPLNPTLSLIHTNRNVLEISISPQGCHLLYKDGSNVPPFFSTLGNRALTADAGTLEFYASKDRPTTRIPKRNVVPYEDMIRAAKWFCAHGVWPQAVLDWEIIDRQ